MNCRSFEMQSLFMLVRCSWASPEGLREASSCGQATAPSITRVGSSRGPSSFGALLPKPREHLQDLVGSVCSKGGQGVPGGKHVADQATQPKNFAIERDPVRSLGKQLRGPIA